MQKRLSKLYRLAHATAVGAARRAPVPSSLFGPPKGIVDDMGAWVENYVRRRPGSAQNCWYSPILPEKEIVRRAPRGLSAPPDTFAEVRRIRQPAIFTACVPRARVVMRTGLVLSPDDYVFGQSCSWLQRPFLSDIEYNSLRPLLRPEKLRGDFMTIVSRASHSNYYHWMTECLPRLCVARELPEVPILLPAGLSAWQRESLAAMGVAPARMLELGGACYQAERLYFPSYAGHTGNVSSWALDAMRQKLCGEARVKAGTRLYVARGDASHRRISNEAEIARALEAHGFVAVEGRHLSFGEQARLFAEAEVIVGAHGAGLTNLMFAPEGATVIEVIDPRHPIACYYALSASLGQRYWFVAAENESEKRGARVRPGYDDIYVPADSLLRTLDAALGDAA
jgi:hypothetical protein